MLSKSPYTIGLGPNILGRAKLILGLLLLFFIIFTVAGIEQGTISGDLERIFLKPFQQFAADFSQALQPSPTPTLLPQPSISPTLTIAPVKKSVSIIKQTQPVFSNCISKNIREGEFASEKCYSPQDFEDLNYYLGRYSDSQFDLKTAEDSMKITCQCRVQQECDFFKQSCQDDQQKKSQAEADINKYRGIIQGIIAKGH